MASSGSEFEEDDIDYTQPLLYDENQDSGSEFELPKDGRPKRSKAVGKTSASGALKRSKSRDGRTTNLALRTKNQIKEDGRRPRDRAPLRAAKKRKAERPSDYEERQHAKRIKADPDENYLSLLNNEINRVVHPKAKRGTLKKTQIGSSAWTREEKAAFFLAASRHGKHAYPPIASRIGTKSPLQVAEYVDILESELKLRKKGVKRFHPVTDDQIPAALEVSQECCEAMEVYAQELERAEQEWKREREVKKWGKDAWLLTQETDTWMRRDLRAKKSDPERYRTLIEAVPAVEFFELRNWLSMSRGVFMNPAGEAKADQNWRTIVEEDEEQEHGIFATAFSDFHTLAKDITKKIVANAQFFAMSRTRMYDTDRNKVRKRECEVTALDVRTAVENMGLPLNADEFWQTAARRNHLNLNDDDVGDTPLSYDEVEESLSKRHKVLSSSEYRRLKRLDRREQALLEAHARAEALEKEVQGESQPDQADIDTESENGESDENLNSDSDSEVSVVDFVSKPKASQRTSKEDAYHLYISSLDTLTSIKNEALLWSSLHIEPPFPLSEAVQEAESKLARTPKVALKREVDRYETEQWREKTEYLAPWETLDGLPGKQDWVKNEATMHSVTQRERAAIEERELRIEPADNEPEADKQPAQPGQELSNERIVDSDNEGDDSGSNDEEILQVEKLEKLEKEEENDARSVLSSIPHSTRSPSASLPSVHLFSQSPALPTSSPQPQPCRSTRNRQSMQQGIADPNLPSSSSGLFDDTGRVRSITPVISSTQMDTFMGGTQTQRDELPGFGAEMEDEDSEEEWLRRGR